MARGDWAVYGFVRAGIEARARLQRVEEEPSQLRLHAQRLVHWIHRRLGVLLAILNEPDSQIFDINLKTIIIHHYRVIKSLLKADRDTHLLGPEERAILLPSQRQIVELLNPEKVSITEIAEQGDYNREIIEDAEDGINPDLRDDDIDSVGSMEDEFNPEIQEEELGGFIAERLQDELDKDLVDKYIADRIMEDVDEEMGMMEGEEEDEDLDAGYRDAQAE
jgi:hypothetical protein